MATPELLQQKIQVEDIGSQEFTFYELFDRFVESDSRYAEKINGFLDKVRAKYSPLEASYIERALIISTVAHQWNYDSQKRYRKSLDEQGKKIPYIYHPLEGADKLVDTGLNWTLPCAYLLHDVAEDVDLGDELDRPDKWLDVFAREFADTQKAEYLKGLIKGLTEVQLPDEFSPQGRQIRSELEATQIFKMISAFMASGRLKGSLPQQKLHRYEMEPVFEVVYNLRKLFDQAFLTDDHLAILILKITDIWHNFQSPDWLKPAKRLRGRLAASLAEWMGWYEMRSELVTLLAEVTDTTSPYAPELDREYPPRGYVIDTSRQDGQIADILKMLTTRFDWNEDNIRVFSGWPISNTSDDFTNWRESSLPPPEYVLKVPRNYMQDLFNNGKPYYIRRFIKNDRVNSGQSIANLSPQKYINDEFYIEIFGRSIITYQVNISNDPVYILRFESDEAHIIDYFRQSSDISAKDIPEMTGLFHTGIRQTELWDFHRDSLTGFLYEPNMPFSLGNYVMGVFFENHLIFVDGTWTYRDLSYALGIDDGIQKVYLCGYDNVVFDVSADKMIYKYRPGISRRRNRVGRIIGIL